MAAQVSGCSRSSYQLSQAISSELFRCTKPSFLHGLFPTVSHQDMGGGQLCLKTGIWPILERILDSVRVLKA